MKKAAIPGRAEAVVRRTRRKCAYCGRWIKADEGRVYVGSIGKFRSEAHFAHESCAPNDKLRRSERRD